MRLAPNEEHSLRYLTFPLLIAAARPAGRRRSREDELAILAVFVSGPEKPAPSV